MKTLQDKHAMVLGLGISGLAMARWCVRLGAIVTVVDTRVTPPQLDALKRDVPTANFINSSFNDLLLENNNVQLLLISPGLNPEELASIISRAKEMGVAVYGELTLFSMALSRLDELQAYKPVVLAITGTNGKTTVTSLVGKLIERAGKSVALAGNIGPSLLDTLMTQLDAQLLPEVWALELSSFQLNDVSSFEPTAGVVLNISQDHLDWHGSMEAYAKAKSFVFGSMGLMVVNREDPEVMQMLAKAISVNKSRKYISFGSDVPLRDGDFGLETVNGMSWLVRAVIADETVSKKRNSAARKNDGIYIQRLMPAEALRIRGRHNAVNALVALALAEIAGCSLASMLYGLREYVGEPHRVESIGVIKNIEYFDDSKGTNVGATVAALVGLGVDRKVVVILGGEGKGQNFTPLVMPVRQYVRAAVLIGKDKLVIAEALREASVPLLMATSMAEAVQIASENAQAGDAVLMSPACASFDMFNNYEHRGQVFCSIVNEMAAGLGEGMTS